MRIAAFDRKDGAGLGVIAGEELIDLTAVDASAPRELGAALRAPGGLKALEAIAARAGAGHRLKLSGVTLRMPVETPGKILCLGLNYIEHVNEGPFQRPDYPTLFMRCMTSLVPANAPLLRPKASIQLDYDPVNDCIESCFSGKWRTANSTLCPGQVPWSAFRFRELRDRLEKIDWTIELP